MNVIILVSTTFIIRTLLCVCLIYLCSLFSVSRKSWSWTMRVSENSISQIGSHGRLSLNLNLIWKVWKTCVLKSTQTMSKVIGIVPKGSQPTWRKINCKAVTGNSGYNLQSLLLYTACVFWCYIWMIKVLTPAKCSLLMRWIGRGISLEIIFYVQLGVPEYYYFCSRNVLFIYEFRLC